MKYACGTCGAEGVRLWRESHLTLDNISLRCLGCALDHEKAAGHLAEEHSRPYGLMKHLDSGCLGYLVAARPTGDTFWGHTSGDQATVDAWCALPFAARRGIRLEANP